MKEQDYRSQQQQKPTTVEVGQRWWHVWMRHERPYQVVAIVMQRGCSPQTSRQLVPWAKFRKSKGSMCCSMLSDDQWLFLGDAT